MIDKKLLMNSIKAETEELADQRVKIHKDCMNNLRDMNYSRVIMDSINLHVIEGGIRIFNDLSEMIEEGNFELKIQKNQLSVRNGGKPTEIFIFGKKVKIGENQTITEVIK